MHRWPLNLVEVPKFLKYTSRYVTGSNKSRLMWRSKLALAMPDPFKMHIHIHIHSLKYMEARVVLVMALWAGMEAHARARWRARSGIGTRRLCHTGLGLHFFGPDPWSSGPSPFGQVYAPPPDPCPRCRQRRIPARVISTLLSYLRLGIFTPKTKSKCQVFWFLVSALVLIS
jgi:hypothetical protein